MPRYKDDSKEISEVFPASAIKAKVAAKEIEIQPAEDFLVHGTNLGHKEMHKDEYNDDRSRNYLKEIRKEYAAWKAANFALKGPLVKAADNDSKIISQRVELLNRYKDFIDQKHYAEHFDSRSNLHSTVLEEFMYYLFKDVAATFSEHALVGKSHTFKDLFFMPTSYSDMVEKPNIRIEKKDHDFVIGTRVITTSKTEGSKVAEENTFDVPAVAIECKTYLDKTMLESSSTSAEQLKSRNPNAIYIVVMEWIKLTEDVNLKKFKVDQIYVLRKQKNTDRKYRFAEKYLKKPIYADAVEHLFNYVRAHLSQPWTGGVAAKLDQGFLL